LDWLHTLRYYKYIDSLSIRPFTQCGRRHESVIMREAKSKEKKRKSWVKTGKVRRGTRR
jgi:hypothetical protein